MGRATSEYAWAIWLAAPLLVTIVAAVGFWWRGRDRSGPSVRAAISDHHRYLETLAVSTSARGDRLWAELSEPAEPVASAEPLQTAAFGALETAKEPGAGDRRAIEAASADVALDASRPKTLDVAS